MSDQKNAQQEGATKKCSHCQSDIHENAKKCPSCQADLRSWPARHPILSFLGGFILLIILVISLSGGDTTSTQDNSTPTSGAQESSQQSQSAEQGTWQTVKSWSGNGIKKTEPFTIAGDQWRINWVNKGGSYGGGIFQIYVQEPGSDIPVSVAANTPETGSDTSYVYEDGTFYLNINAANTNWEVEIEELR